MFAGASIIPVSSKIGAGIDDLLAALDEQVAACWDFCRDRAELTDAAPRLPIDRCFTIKGAGTVVTGALHDAPVAVGDEPSSRCRRVRPVVRGIQVHGDTPRALARSAWALNLVGDAVAALDRGEMLGVAGRFGQTMRFMMAFTYLGSRGEPPRVLESGARVHVMAGNGRGYRSHHVHGGRGPMAVGETRIVQGALGKLAAAACRGPCRGAVLFARDAYWRWRARAAFALPVARASLPKENVRCMRRSSPAISRAVGASWRCRRCRLRRLMLPRL